MVRALLVVVLLVGDALSARILGINPTPSISHQKPFLIIMKALAERGHDVTIITTDPLKDPPKNLTQIDMSFTYGDREAKQVMLDEIMNIPSEKLIEALLPMTDLVCEAHFNYPEIQNLWKTEQKFDVVILETVTYWCYFGLVHKLGSPPVIGFISVGIPANIGNMIGYAGNPAYIPEALSAYSDHMSFWERLHNSYLWLYSLRATDRVLSHQDRVVQKHFGPDVPRLAEMTRNISLVLANNHFSVSYPQPLLPSVVEVVGLHVEKERRPLPKDVQQFLDGAQHGFVYFSLGSNMHSSFLSAEVRGALLAAFSELPQRVLWKFETEDLPRLPANVKLIKWAPQQDVLAHPNARLFITQGGLQSFNEASYFGVPLVGIPCFGDQAYNVAKMVSAGIGERLSIDEITKESALHVLRRVLEIPSYADNMRRFSAVFREHQETSLERAVWWVEYVVRHRGAPHLRSAALELEWWQLMLLDVVAFLLAALLTAAFVLYKVLRLVLGLLKRPTKLKSS